MSGRVSGRSIQDFSNQYNKVKKDSHQKLKVTRYATSCELAIRKSLFLRFKLTAFVPICIAMRLTEFFNVEMSVWPARHAKCTNTYSHV